MHILIVEDNPAVASTIEAALKTLNPKPWIDIASSAGAALRWSDGYSYDIAICDVQLHDSNNSDYIHLLADKGISIIVVSGAPLVETSVRPDYVFLMKPFGFFPLLEAINTLKERRGDGSLSRKEKTHP